MTATDICSQSPWSPVNNQSAIPSISFRVSILNTFADFFQTRIAWVGSPAYSPPLICGLSRKTASNSELWTSILPL
jgi:hypothetical protein